MIVAEDKMKKFLYVFITLSLFLFIIGCIDTEQTEEELYDIYYIREAPKATEKHDLSEIIKVVLTKNEDLTDETIAIDVEKSGIYIDPSIQSIGIRASKGLKEIDDIQKVMEILEKYHVQEWKEDYSTPENSSTTEDGVGWSLYIQFKDGTVEQHMGSGTSMKSVAPNDFEDFFHELHSFVEERLREDTK